MTERNEQQKQMARVIAKAWADEGYKKRLLANPATVLKEEGVTVPEGVSVRVVENGPAQWTIVLPARPEDAGGVENLEERLAAAAYPYT